MPLLLAKSELRLASLLVDGLGKPACGLEAGHALADGRLKGALEVAEDAIEERDTGFVSRDRMRLARKYLQVIGDSGVNKRLDELQGIGDVHVVVAGAVHQEKTSMQFCGRGQ